MPEWLIQTLLILSPFGSGLMILVLDRFHRANTRRLSHITDNIESLHVDVRHIDECVDEVKQRVSRLEGTFYGPPNPYRLSHGKNP